jgi:uncharacterized coiled-coil DUF342 family protein
MSRSATATAADVQPIDRLEEKVRQMVSLVDTLRAEKAQALDTAARLQQEVASLKTRLAEGAQAATELGGLREERDMIRARVAQMIAQIDQLSL